MFFWLLVSFLVFCFTATDPKVNPDTSNEPSTEQITETLQNMTLSESNVWLTFKDNEEIAIPLSTFLNLEYLKDECPFDGLNFESPCKLLYMYYADSFILFLKINDAVKQIDLDTLIELMAYENPDEIIKLYALLHSRNDESNLSATNITNNDESRVLMPSLEKKVNEGYISLKKAVSLKLASESICTLIETSINTYAATMDLVVSKLYQKYKNVKFSVCLRFIKEYSEYLPLCFIFPMFSIFLHFGNCGFDGISHFERDIGLYMLIQSNSGAENLPETYEKQIQDLIAMFIEFYSADKNCKVFRSKDTTTILSSDFFEFLNMYSCEEGSITESKLISNEGGLETGKSIQVPELYNMLAVTLNGSATSDLNEMIVTFKVLTFKKETIRKFINQ